MIKLAVNEVYQCILPVVHFKILAVYEELKGLKESEGLEV